MWENLLTAVALVLILEGLLPFVAPEVWLKAVRDVSQARPKTVRIGGFVALLIGVLLLQVF